MKQEPTFNLENWPLPDEYLLELGRVSAVWVSLESYVDLSISKFAGYDQITDVRPFIVLRHSSFPQKLDAMSALCEYLKEDHPRLEKHAEVIAKIRSVQKSRNRLFHNNISFNPKTKTYQLAEGSARGKLKVSLTNITPSDIKRVAKEIHLTMVELHELVTGKKVSPDTW